MQICDMPRQRFVLKGLQQTVRVMRMTAIIILATCLQVSAKAISQDARVTLNEKQISLEQLFNILEKKTDYRFTYSKTFLPVNSRVDVKADNEMLSSVLGRVLGGLHLTYRQLSEKQIAIVSRQPVFNNGLIPDTTFILRGSVHDEKDQPLAGVAVRVKGSRAGTFTNESGYFELKNISPSATLIFNSVGFNSLEYPVNNKSSIEVALKEDADGANLQQVTVVSNGYVTISKDRSAGSFAKPDMATFNERTASMNVLSRLDGLVPGLTVNNGPGGNSLLVRGLTTIGVNDPARGTWSGMNASPLVVVDGVPFDDIASVNPNDVEDITVLKDATAASIWGSRAANGVIVITTRKGTRDGKLKIAYDGFVHFRGKPALTYLPKLNSRQLIASAADIFEPEMNTWGSLSAPSSSNYTGVLVPPHELIMYNKYRNLISADRATAQLDSLAAINNGDHITDTWYRNNILTNHTISVRGGGEKYSFYGSLAYTNNGGYSIREKNETFKVNLRQDLRMGKRVTAFLVTDLTNNIINTKNPLTPTSSTLPYVQYRDAAGKGLDLSWMNWPDSIRRVYEDKSKISLVYNPWNETEYITANTNGILARINSGITVQLVRGLRFEGMYGIVNGRNRIRTVQDEKSYAVRDEVVSFTTPATSTAALVYYLPSKGGKLITNNSETRNWTVRNQLHYDKDWLNKQHQLTVLLGQEAQSRKIVTDRTTVRGFDSRLYSYNSSINYQLLTGSTGLMNPVKGNNGINRSVLTASDIFSTTEEEYRFLSYYSTMAYTFDRKYTINASWRIDESNLFGKDKGAQNKPVWSIGMGWNLGDENFMKQVDWLNRLTVRATYGITGNAPNPGVASSDDIIQIVSNSIFPGGVGVTIATPANRSLTWESTQVINAGVDFQVLNGRLSGSLDLYRKHTSNMLGLMPVNTFGGYNFITGNLGDMMNKGIEVQLTSLNLQKKDFSWRSVLNLSYNHNKITRLNRATAITTGSQKISQIFMEGETAFAVFAYQYAGLDNMGDPMVYLADKTTSKAPAVTQAADVVYAGTQQPVWNGGFSNSLRYKNWSLGVNAIFNLGHVMRRPNLNTLYTGGRITENISTDFLNRWQQPGDEQRTQIPAYVSIASNRANTRNTSYYTMGDLNVMDASFIKLRDITLAYSIPAQLLKRVKADDITLRVQLVNFMLWKANDYGVDPEIGAAMYQGQKTISVGAHIAF